jgi:AraC-like DNA-binding protein
MQMQDHITNIAAGDVCWILPGDEHGELAKRDCSYESIWITIYFNTIALHLSGRNCEDGLFYTTDGYSMKSAYDCTFFTNNIIKEVAGKQYYYNEVIKSNTLQLLFLILRMVNEQGVHIQGNKPWKEYIALQVRQFVEKNYSNTIRLNDVSQELCISPNYLNSIFKSVTGKTIIQFIDEYRIDKAKQLLKDNSYNINDISEQLGYYDQYHFSKIFKKSTGFSPTQYKKR